MRVDRYLGLALGGGKTDRTSVAVIEYFPEQKKLFLRRLYRRIQSDQHTSADAIVFDIIASKETNIKSVGVNVALSFPVCITCRLKCPGFEKCRLPEIKWRWKIHKRRSKLKRPNKLFTPYTERCTEIYLNSELEEPFYPSHALGSNSAPLMARAHFLKRRLGKIKMIENFPQLTVWRLGLALGVPKSQLHWHRHSTEGETSRRIFLDHVVKSQQVFLYQQDILAMVEDVTAFEAFLSALTAYFHAIGQCEKPPADFPVKEGWIQFPKTSLRWSKELAKLSK